MNLKKIIKESLDDFDWIKDEELPIIPYIGKKFKLITDNGQDSGRRYQILDYYFEGEYNKDFYVKTILLNPRTLEPETKTFGLTQGQIFRTPIKRSMELINNGNWVFLDKINESQDDFDWARGEVIFTINEILGKKCSYRENNLSKLEVEYDVSMFDLSRGDLKLGPIRYDESLFWWITGLKGNKVVVTLIDGTKISDYTIEEVEQYVNLGIWVLFDDRGNVLNDISK
jgi:hypothetical protein